MLVHIQFPIIDFRSFSEHARLAAPGWPAPLPHEEFVRGAGTIRQRPSGGLSGWIAEDKCCDARRAVRLPLNKLEMEGPLLLRLSVAFRRFYFDGLAVGKLEIGFSIEHIHSNLSVSALLKAVVNLPATVPSRVYPTRWGWLLSATGIRSKPTPHHSVNVTLLGAGNAFAKFYVSATTKHGESVDHNDACAGPMSIFVLAHKLELTPADLPKNARRIDLKDPGLTLYHWWMNIDGQQIHIWTCLHDNTSDASKIRNLRVYLLRMNAESETLNRVLNAIAINKIAPAAQSPSGQVLQAYLNGATKNILGLSAKTRQFAQDSKLLAQVAMATESVLSESARDALRSKMEQLAYRKNIVSKAVQYAGAEPPPAEHAPKTTIVNIGLINNLVVNMDLSKQQSSLLAFIFGVIFVAVLLAVNIFIPNPTPTQYETFRIILALAAGGVGAMIPGILNLNMSAGPKFALRAGGALAVFVIVYFFQPGLSPV